MVVCFSFKNITETEVFFPFTNRTETEVFFSVYKLNSKRNVCFHFTNITEKGVTYSLLVDIRDIRSGRFRQILHLL